MHDWDGKVLGINQRYLDSKENPHPTKMRMVKNKESLGKGCFYTPCLRSIKKSLNIWFVESPIDALTLHIAGCPAVALLSAAYVENFPIDWITASQICNIWLDNDQAGQAMTEHLYHKLLTAGHLAQVVKCQAKDPNDFLNTPNQDLAQLKSAAYRFNTAVFPTKTSVFIPLHEFDQLKKFECFLDSTVIWCERKQKDDTTGEYEVIPYAKHVAGFRIFRLDPITVYPPKSAMGELDNEAPSEKTLLLYKRPESPYLQKSIMDKKDLGKPKAWQELGILKLLMQSMSRDHSHGSRVVNVVGLVKLGAKIQLNDTHNTYLSDDLCIYHDLAFPETSATQAKAVLMGMENLFKEKQALVALVWLLGSFLKIFLHFWPHMSCVASAGSGKSTLIERLSYLTGAKSFEHTILSSSYQQMRLVGNHAFACLVDEISRAKPNDLHEFVSLMNASYNHPLRPRGQRWYLLAGSVGLFGQDFFDKDAAIISKMISITIDKSQQKELYTPNTRFPVSAWGEFLIATQAPKSINDRLTQAQKDIAENMTTKFDENLERFIKNYAAIVVAWELLSEFSNCSEIDLQRYFPCLNNTLSKLKPLGLNRSQF